jgi:hypothetical protein
MKSFCTLTLMGLVLALASATPAAAKAAPVRKATQGPIPEVTVVGCVTKGSAEFCWNLKTAEGTTYSFAGQPVEDGKCYTVTGKQTMGFCHQGTQLGVSNLVVSTINCCDTPLPPTPAK